MSIGHSTLFAATSESLQLLGRNWNTEGVVMGGELFHTSACVLEWVGVECSGVPLPVPQMLWDSR